MGRPVALVLTKFDRVLASRADSGDATAIDGRFSAEFVEQLVDQRFGMTRHTLAAQRTGRGDFRGELVWGERQRQPADERNFTPWDWKDLSS